jgi:hypothetical protein
MPDESGPERLRDYFKYISTLDAAAGVAAVALRDGYGLGIESIGLALVCFGISAYLCITAMFLLTRTPRLAEGELIDWFVIAAFSLATGGIVVLVGQSVFGG